MMSLLSSPASAGRSDPGRGADSLREGPLATIADVSPCEQDRLLREHGEAVADHMANHFSRRAPHLAARSGLAWWQRAAGVAAALGVVALLVVAPLVLLIVLAGAITVITAAQVVIAVAARWRRRRPRPAVPPRCRTPGFPATRPGPGLPGAGRDRRHGAVPGAAGLPEGPAGGADPGRAPGYRHQAGDRRRGPGGVHPGRGDPAGGAADQAAVLQRRAAAGQGRPDRHLRRRGPPRPRPAAVVAAQFAAADDTLACVQAKLMVANAAQSFITRQFALEYCLRYELTLPGLARLGLPIPLGGTSNHFRTQVLRELGGWDAWNVTEDADLGMRCTALGYRSRSPTRSPTARCRTGSAPGPSSHPLAQGIHGHRPGATRNPARTWRTFGRAGTITMPTFMAGTPLLYLAQPIVLAIWISGYKGLIAQHLPAAPSCRTSSWRSLPPGPPWSRRPPAATARLGRVRPALPAYWVMHWTASCAALPADPRPLPVGEDPPPRHRHGIEPARPGLPRPARRAATPPRTPEQGLPGFRNGHRAPRSPSPTPGAGHDQTGDPDRPAPRAGSQALSATWPRSRVTAHPPRALAAPGRALHPALPDGRPAHRPGVDRQLQRATGSA